MGLVTMQFLMTTRLLRLSNSDAYGNESEMTIYSPRKDLLRVIKIPYLVQSNHAAGVYAGGELHWIVSRFDNFSGSQMMVFKFILFRKIMY